MKTVKITISGVRASGKSLIGAVIVKALEESGLTVAFVRNPNTNSIIQYVKYLNAPTYDDGENQLFPEPLIKEQRQNIIIDEVET